MTPILPFWTDCLGCPVQYFAQPVHLTKTNIHSHTLSLIVGPLTCDREGKKWAFSLSLLYQIGVCGSHAQKLHPEPSFPLLKVFIHMLVEELLPF